MAYFANGAEGLFYQEHYCFNCKNYRDKKDGRDCGCAIWDLHLFYSYELCNSKSKAKVMLDFLIPEEGKEINIAGECSMFLKNKCLKKK